LATVAPVDDLVELALAAICCRSMIEFTLSGAQAGLPADQSGQLKTSYIRVSVDALTATVSRHYYLVVLRQ
jgi:hypothetical protein